MVQWPELAQSEASSQELLLGLPMGAGAQVLEPSSGAFLGHQQEAELKVEQLDLNQCPNGMAGLGQTEDRSQELHLVSHMGGQ